ncbi:MAG: redox-sensitive transcriptional activator SoxR [Shimia sp.]
MPPNDPGLSIGAVARRTGLAVSAIRFYADRGLVHPVRTAGGNRQFRRSDLRRISFILAAQRLGFALSEVAAALATLPDDRTPTKADWTRLAQGFRATLDARIAALEGLRDTLDGCIGCGCLSLEACGLHNLADHLAAEGPGPRRLSSTPPAS